LINNYDSYLSLNKENNSMLFFRNGIIFSLLLLIFQQSFAIAEQIDLEYFRSNILYYEDVENTLSFEEITSEFTDVDFIKNSNKTLNFGLTKSTYWFKIKLTNNSIKDKKYYLQINNPKIKVLEYFELNDKYLIKHINTGSTKEFNSRLINDANFIFDINVQSRVEKTILLKVNSHGEYLKLPVFLSTYDDLGRNKSKSVNNIFLGILLTLILLNIFYSISYKENSYLFFIFYLISILLYQLNNFGVLFQNIWPNYPNLNNISGLLFSSLAGLSFLYFTKSFFQVKTISKKLNDLYRLTLIVLAILVFFTLLLFHDYWIKLGVVLFLILVVGIYGIITSFDKYYASFKASIYFRISLFILALGILIQVFGNHFGIGENFINVFLIKITLILHLLTITFGLSERYRQIKIDTDKIAEDLENLERDRLDEILNQKEILIAQREELLSQKEELEVQQEQLQEYNIELEKLSLVAKETHNIIYIFDKEGNLEWFNESFSSLLGVPSFDKEQVNIPNYYSSTFASEHSSTSFS
jgi:PAS domain-containing protein